MQKDVDVIVGALAVRTGVQMLTGLWVRVPAHDGQVSRELLGLPWSTGVSIAECQLSSFIQLQFLLQTNLFV